MVRNDILKAFTFSRDTMHGRVFILFQIDRSWKFSFYYNGAIDVVFIVNEGKRVDYDFASVLFLLVQGGPKLAQRVRIQIACGTINLHPHWLFSANLYATAI